MEAEFTVLTSLGGVFGPLSAARSWWFSPPDAEVLKHFTNLEEFI
jgi:hypothetical protein